jgi:hypothetical protein
MKNDVEEKLETVEGGAENGIWEALVEDQKEKWRSESMRNGHPFCDTRPDQERKKGERKKGKRMVRSGNERKEGRKEGRKVFGVRWLGLVGVGRWGGMGMWMCVFGSSSALLGVFDEPVEGHVDVDFVLG